MTLAINDQLLGISQGVGDWLPHDHRRLAIWFSARVSP